MAGGAVTGVAVPGGAEADGPQAQQGALAGASGTSGTVVPVVQYSGTVAAQWARWRTSEEWGRARHSRIVEASRDVFEYLPENFAENLASPCWHEPSEGTLCTPALVRSNFTPDFTG